MVHRVHMNGHLQTLLSALEAAFGKKKEIGVQERKMFSSSFNFMSDCPTEVRMH